MSGILRWLGDALRYVYDHDRLTGLAVIVLLLLVLFAAVVVALTATPLGGWIAQWLGVG